MYSFTIWLIILLNASFLLAQQEFIFSRDDENRPASRNDFDWNSPETGQDFRRRRQQWNFGGNDGGFNFNSGNNNNNGRPFNTRRPTRPNRTRPTQTTTPVFPNWGTSSTTESPSTSSSTPNTVSSSTIVIPGGETRRPLCEEACQTTPQYNPVCGDDNITYANIARFNCAVRCGKRITIQFYGACS